MPRRPSPRPDVDPPGAELRRPQRFHATLLLGGATATGIEVPPEVVDALGAGRRAPVRVTLREHTFRTTLGSMGGRTMVPVSAEHRALAGIAAGDGVDVTIEVDTEPRTVDVPEDLAAALAAVADARSRFDALAPSHRKRWVLAVEGAKSVATRQRRIDQVLAAVTRS